MASHASGRTLIVMESRSNLAADLPVLYRAALDAVDVLSQFGRRQEATKLRDRAIRAYSRAWDEACRRDLEDVQGKAVAASAVEATRSGRPLPGAL
ncbi:MAG TPA: hypothetical protein VKR24_02645 [Candidatus Limnocylindrales bacterium]|nr:hypothetical protein [Candidatus Limnocylindrales bacterium]